MPRCGPDWLGASASRLTSIGSMAGGPDWTSVLEARLGAPVTRMKRLPGGASKETWMVDTADQQLVVRRGTGGIIHPHMLSLEHEFLVLRAAHAAGVKAPRPVAYLGDLGGRDAFAMERVDGETIGRRIVKAPPPGLVEELAEELAKIHAIPIEQVSFVDANDPVDRFRGELAHLGGPHPALEYAVRWLDEHRPDPLPHVVAHGDFRIGNAVVTDAGLIALLDWEFAHIADPREDIAFALVRAWRFGMDDLVVGGVGDVGPYLERYRELTGLDLDRADLHWWEILGNIRWAIGALSQGRRHLAAEERSVELAVLGRLAAEMEYEILDLIEQVS